MSLIDVKDIKSLIQKLSSKLEVFFTKFSASEEFKEWNEVGKIEEQDKDTGIIKMMYPTKSGKNLNITISPTEEDDKYDILFELDNKYLAELKSADMQTYEQKFKQLVNQLELIPNLEASKKLYLKLSKIIGTSYVDISLQGVKANYDAEEAIKDINDIINEDNIEEILLPEPQIFEFQIEDNSQDTEYSILDYNSEPHFEYDSIKNLVNKSFELMMLLWSIHWNVVGDKFYDIHELLDKYNEKLSDEFDYFQELLSQKYAETVDVFDEPHPNIFTLAISGDDALQSIISQIQSYLDILELEKYNLDDANIALLNDWYRFWDKECNYMLNHYANS